MNMILPNIDLEQYRIEYYPYESGLQICQTVNLSVLKKEDKYKVTFMMIEYKEGTTSFKEFIFYTKPKLLYIFLNKGITLYSLMELSKDIVYRHEQINNTSHIDNFYKIPSNSIDKKALYRIEFDFWGEGFDLLYNNLKESLGAFKEYWINDITSYDFRNNNPITKLQATILLLNTIGFAYDSDLDDSEGSISNNLEKLLELYIDIK